MGSGKEKTKLISTSQVLYIFTVLFVLFFFLAEIYDDAKNAMNQHDGLSVRCCLFVLLENKIYIVLDFRPFNFQSLNLKVPF